MHYKAANKSFTFKLEIQRNEREKKCKFEESGAKKINFKKL